MDTITYNEIERLEQILTELLLAEWEAQGHYMNGAAIKDMEFKIKQTADELILSGYMYPYANILAAGVRANKIPFGGVAKRGQGKGGTSIYITALQNYVKARMEINDSKKSLSIAFAIAQTQKKEGMPTRGSFKFSHTGKRTDFVEEALRKGEDRITDEVGEWTKNMVSIHLDALVAKWQVGLNTD